MQMATAGVPHPQRGPAKRLMSAAASAIVAELMHAPANRATNATLVAVLSDLYQS